jgi:hypothetical protein
MLVSSYAVFFLISCQQSSSICLWHVLNAKRSGKGWIDVLHSWLWFSPVWRMISNRASAQRSRQRRQERLDHLEVLVSDSLDTDYFQITLLVHWVVHLLVVGSKFKPLMVHVTSLVISTVMRVILREHCCAFWDKLSNHAFVLQFTCLLSNSRSNHSLQQGESNGLSSSGFALTVCVCTWIAGWE